MAHKSNVTKRFSFEHMARVGSPGRIIPIGALVIASYTNYSAAASNFGTTGLLDIPSAEMQLDTSFTTSISASPQYDYLSLTYQALPWVEATFRYRRVNDVENSAWPDYYDRNFAAKLQMIDEGYYIPAISIGSRDFVGTGLVGSEYLVGTKNWNRFSFTLGVGWGDLAGEGDFKNPLIYLSDKFADRGDGFVNGREPDQAGKIPLDSLFQGKSVGVFGGISYRLSSWPVDLILERNPEFNRTDVNRFEVDKPESTFSLGVRWFANDNLTVTAGRQQGDSWSLNVAYRQLTNKKIKTRALELRDQNLLFGETGSINWYSSLLRDMENSGLLLLDGSLDGNEKTAQLTIGNLKYRDWNQAQKIALNLADLNLPPSVKEIEFTLAENGYTGNKITFKRPTYTVLVEELDTLQIYGQKSAGKPNAIPDYATKFTQNKIAINLGLSTRVQLFDPDDPFRYGVGISLSTVIPLPKGWTLQGSYTHYLEQNFDESTRASNSVLPHVRTDIVDYLNDTDRLQSLFLEKRTTSKAKLHWRHFAGALGEMYFGVGSEVLYQPYNSRVGFGASYAYVQQRSSESDFGTRDYTALTGFISVYWDSPFYDYDLALHVGQYLAEDKGSTLDISRVFSNGWTLGAWATVTDVSSDEFGEGSFDKGLYIQIPWSLGSHNSRKTSKVLIRPVQRDGGQKLENFVGKIWNDRPK